MKKGKKIYNIVAIMMVTMMVLAACGGGGKVSTNESDSKTTPSTPSTNNDTSKDEKEDFSYPMDGSVTLTWWLQLNPNVSATSASLGDTPFAAELQKQTGVEVEYIHPAQGSEDEAFNLLLASGELPDIIERPWYNFPGGPDKAIQDEYIIPLNDVIDQYAPNLKAYLEKEPEVEKMIKTDNGDFYAFPFIRSEDKLRVFFGPVVRQDWLDDLGLTTPETIAEWEEVLKAFRDKKGAEAAFSARPAHITLSSIFMGAYGVQSGFYQDNGKVKYGFIESGYKDYLTLLNKWYSEGLIDKNFATMDQKAYEANILNGRAGITLGYLGSGIGAWTSAKADDPSYKLAGLKYPVVNKGETPMTGQKSLTYETGNATAITTSCKNVEAAARLLDYGYGEAGMNLYNFGIEGKSFTFVNGVPTYTDLILKNPDGLSIAHAMSKYIRANYNGPMIQSGYYADGYFQLDSQLEAIQMWQDTNADKHILPTITPTPEESAEMAGIMNDIATYQEEMMLKFIMGVEPLDKFEEYVAEIKKMGIDRALEINQAAFERYDNR